MGGRNAVETKGRRCAQAEDEEGACVQGVMGSCTGELRGEGRDEPPGCRKSPGRTLRDWMRIRGDPKPLQI